MSYIYIVFIVQYKICLFVLKIEHADDNDKTDNHDNLDEVIDISLPPLSSMISTTSTVLATPSVSSTIMVNNFVNSASGQCSSIPQVTQSICFSIYVFSNYYAQKHRISRIHFPKFHSQVCQNRRKSSRQVLERKISVASIMSDDSNIMEEASRSLGSAIGFSRVGSTG